MPLRRSIESTLQRLGIEPGQMMTLVGVYFKQDLRGQKLSLSPRRGDYLSSNQALLSTLGLYVLFGVGVGMMAFADLDVFTYSLVAQSYTLFLVALAVLAESGSVIFNEVEADVIGHLPVAPKTVLAAKIINLFCFSLLLALAGNAIPSITGIWAERSLPLFPLIHLVTIVLNAAFATSLVVVSYGLLARLVSKERFDNFVAYSQVAMALFFMFGYQLMPRLIDRDLLGEIPAVAWYHFAYPPAWFAGLTAVLMGRSNFGLLTLALTGIASVVALLSYAMSKMASTYARLALKPEGFKRAAGAPTGGVGRSRSGPGLVRGVILRLVRSPVERAVFDLVLTYLKRNRELKVRVYPSLATIVFLPLVVMVSDSPADPFSVPGQNALELMCFLMVNFVALTVVEGLAFCEHYAAAYVFRVAPIRHVREVHAGLRKMVMGYVAAPAMLMLVILFGLRWRSPLSAVLVMLPWAVLTPTVLVVPFIRRQILPLSRRYQKGQQVARNTFLFLGCFVVLSGFLALQVIAMRERSFYVIFFAATVVVSAVGYQILRRVTGESLPLGKDESAE